MYSCTHVQHTSTYITQTCCGTQFLISIGTIVRVIVQFQNQPQGFLIGIPNEDKEKVRGIRMRRSLLLLTNMPIRLERSLLHNHENTNKQIVKQFKHWPFFTQQLLLQLVQDIFFKQVCQGSVQQLLCFCVLIFFPPLKMCFISKSLFFCAPEKHIRVYKTTVSQHLVKSAPQPLDLFSGRFSYLV